jgi:SAM-dependent methyltransferase
MPERAFAQFWAIDKPTPMTDYKSQFLTALEASLPDNTFVKISLGTYRGTEADLKSIIIKKILVKREEKLSFTYRYKTRDVVKNYAQAEGLGLVREFLHENGFRSANLFALNHDLYFEWLHPEKSVLKKNKPSHTAPPSLAHDKVKKRPIAGKAYLHALGLADETGAIHKNAQDKYRQINHYIDILRPLLQELPARELTKVVDMGAGKGYLTFALYDFLTNVLQVPAQVTGIEYRPELVDLCNQIAREAQFAGLHFAQGTIEQYANADLNVLIALHACDTATDEAIGKGIGAGADLILVAPCCHKQIRREMEQHKAKNELDFLVKHGIFLERQAEMVTDGLRALILEYFGYTTKVIEFVSDVHTPKNVLLIGVKKKTSPEASAAILRKIQATKTYFGIGQHHLERVMRLGEPLVEATSQPA